MSATGRLPVTNPNAVRQLWIEETDSIDLWRSATPIKSVKIALNVGNARKLQ